MSVYGIVATDLLCNFTGGLVMFNRKVLAILTGLLSTSTAAEEMATITIYPGDTTYIKAFICQDEAVAREILNSWWHYGEVVGSFLISVSTQIPGDKISSMPDCLRYDGYIKPIQSVGQWNDLKLWGDSLSITLIELQTYPLLLDKEIMMYGFIIGQLDVTDQ